jgi:hypothetical protein
LKHIASRKKREGFHERIRINYRKATLVRVAVLPEPRNQQLRDGVVDKGHGRRSCGGGVKRAKHG